MKFGKVLQLDISLPLVSCHDRCKPNLFFCGCCYRFFHGDGPFCLCFCGLFQPTSVCCPRSLTDSSSFNSDSTHVGSVVRMEYLGGNALLLPRREVGTRHTDVGVNAALMGTEVMRLDMLV